jgi:CRISPR-associated endoribonuclease Cas6
MPLILNFELETAALAGLPPYPGRALHALFYQWLALGDYNRAVDVHDEEGPRPFTVAPLLRQNGHSHLRFSLLDDTLAPTLDRGIRKTPAVAVLRQKFTLPADGPQKIECSYAHLAGAAGLETKIALNFSSPTSFRSQEMHFPLPDPRLVFQSWLNRWNEFAPADLQISPALLESVPGHVAIGRYDLRTEMVDWGGNKKAVGFVGALQYNIIRPAALGETALRQLNCLADYAAFCGTGHKTAQGMGVTERV